MSHLVLYVKVCTQPGFHPPHKHSWQIHGRLTRVSGLKGVQESLEGGVPRGEGDGVRYPTGGGGLVLLLILVVYTLVYLCVSSLLESASRVLGTDASV